MRWPTDRPSLERDCDVEVLRATGPGGQHRNKVATGIRLHHRPSGITVQATERRSQHQNLEAAWARMAARLDALQAPRKPRKPTRPSRGAVERRLSDKRHTALKKQDRRGSD